MAHQQIGAKHPPIKTYPNPGPSRRMLRPPAQPTPASGPLARWNARRAPARPPGLAQRRGRSAAPPGSQNARQRPSIAAPKPRRPRGAPPGNTNARKHGFYSASSVARPGLDLDFNEQIGRLRSYANILIGRLEASTDTVDILNLQRAIDLCTLSIVRLARIHLVGNPADTEQLEAVNNMSWLMYQALIAVDPEAVSHIQPPDPQLPASGETHEIN